MSGSYAHPGLFLRESVRVSTSRALDSLASAFPSCSGLGESWVTLRLVCCGISWHSSLSWTFHLTLQRLEPRPLSLPGRCPTTELRQSPVPPLVFWLTCRFASVPLIAIATNCFQQMSPRLKRNKWKLFPLGPLQSRSNKGSLWVGALSEQLGRSEEEGRAQGTGLKWLLCPLQWLPGGWLLLCFSGCWFSRLLWSGGLG